MCPICQGKDFRVIGYPSISLKAEKIIRKDYKVVKCNNCDLYFVDPKIDFSEDEWKFLYDENYFGEKSDWYTKKRKIDSKKRLANIAQYAGNKIEHFLDIGCGEGYSLIEAESKGWNAYGLDITDHRIADAKTNTIKFINCDLHSSKLQSDFFDAVYLDSVLEHVVNPMEYLKEIFRILKDGGILYLGVPNEDSLFNDIRKIAYQVSNKNVTEKIKPFQSPYHINGFNTGSLKFSLEKAGFKVVKLRNFACRVEFMKSKPLTKEYLLLLSILPVYLLAVPLRREAYLEAYVQK